MIAVSKRTNVDNLCNAGLGRCPKFLDFLWIEMAAQLIGL